jgi:uncharacterized protein DUF4145
MKVQPSIRESAFDCPHCGAYTTQWWHFLYGRAEPGNKPPQLVDFGALEAANNSKLEGADKTRFVKAIEKAVKGEIAILRLAVGERIDNKLLNLHITECYACRNFAVWVHDRLVFPSAMEADLPNADLPTEVKKDYEEASRIVSLSPRGAAALLRLAIQKLCAFLGEKGKNIDDDIASLVKKGLLPRVQQALDSLRVIGNEAVHPGTMDLRDDRKTAQNLFKLVNLIADQMISHPAQAQEIYSKLPPQKLKAIENRDKNP